MSFQDACANIWNFNLTKENRKQVLRGAQLAVSQLDLDERDISNAADRGWKNMLNWISAEKDERDSICDSLVRSFQ